MPLRPLQPCPACQPVACCSDDPFSYSLVNGPVYENDQVAINFECPPGFTCIAGTYVIPAGRIRFIPNGDTLRLQCCHSEIVRPVPAGATAAQIGVIAQAMVNACALQAAQCAGEATINQGSSFNHGFNNTGFCMEAGCPPGQLLGYTGSAPFLGNGLTMECGRICIAPAIFTSTSVAAANTRARNYILSQISFLLGNGSLQCGYWNAEQVCPDESIIEACTFFSQVDQETADNLALAACGGCNIDFGAIVWAGNDEPGVGVGVVASSAVGDTVNLSGSFCTSPGCCAAAARQAGTVLYTGGETICNAHIEFTGGSGANQLVVRITVDGGQVAGYFPTNTSGNVVFDLPFTVPISVGSTVGFETELVLGINDDGVQCGAGVVVITLGAPP